MQKSNEVIGVQMPKSRILPSFLIAVNIDFGFHVGANLDSFWHKIVQNQVPNLLGVPKMVYPIGPVEGLVLSYLEDAQGGPRQDHMDVSGSQRGPVLAPKVGPRCPKNRSKDR